MDHLFKNTVLTAAVNMMKTPHLRAFDRYFAKKAHLEPTDRLKFDIISGSESILPNIDVAAAATVTQRTQRAVVTMQAPRISEKRFIPTADLNAIRAWGGMGMEMMQSRIAREQMDMRGVSDRTAEYWSCSALKGQILDADCTTVLVDYNLDGTHNVILAGGDLWTDQTNSNPINQIRAWKTLIENDSGAAITAFHTYCGNLVMDALLEHPEVAKTMQYQKGAQIVEDGRITLVSGVTVEEYNANFVDINGVTRRFIEPDQFLLIGECVDLTDCPYAPVVDAAAPGGVGNMVNGKGALFFSKSWKEEDPDGRWIKCEARALPVLQRPGAVVVAKVV